MLKQGKLEDTERPTITLKEIQRSLAWSGIITTPLAELLPDKPKRSALNQLTRALLRKYDCGVRPVQTWTNMHLSCTSFYILVMCLLFLVWDPEEFDGITEISLSSDTIWVPDLIISEFVDVGESPAIPYVYVNSSGMVKNNKPIQVVSACDLEMYAFPFDKHSCPLTFRSWLHSVTEVNLTLWRSADEIANNQKSFMDDGEWELLSVPSRYWQVHQDEKDYAHIQFNVLIRRRPLLYVVSLVIPSIFLMVVDIISFYLPPNSGTRITFKTSVLLGYTVFRVNLMDEMPATAIRTPLIGVFFAVCMALLVLNLAISILVVKLLHHNEKECGGDREAFFQTFQRCIYLRFPILLNVDNPSLPTHLLLQEVVALRLYLQDGERDDSAQSEWVALCCKVDLILFRVYLFILVVYTSTLVILWASWSSI
uniref:5-hydroxytryptamine (serotonin) receptor 3B n=1 Tax=Esox lucius TaxID=8010 RepID=A0A6Q2Z481_ESOLU